MKKITKFTPYLFLMVIAILYSLLNLYIRLKINATFSLKWDEGWFLSVLEKGYEFNGDLNLQQNVAFYPFYPFLSKLISLLFPIIKREYCLILVSNISACISIFLLYRIILQFYSSKIAIFSVLLYLSNPFGFYLFIGYSDSTFLVFCLAFIYFMIIDKNYFLALLCISIASLTRMNGIFLILLYIIFIFQTSDIKKLLYEVALIPVALLGWILFSMYFFFKFDNPFLMFDIYQAWGNKINFSFFNLLTFNNIFFEALDFSPHNPKSLGALIIILMMLLLIFNYKLLTNFLISFSILFLGFFVLIYGPNLISLGRYLLLIFPIYIILANKLADLSKNELTFKDNRVFIILILMFSLNVQYCVFFFEGKIFVS